MSGESFFPKDYKSAIDSTLKATFIGAGVGTIAGACLQITAGGALFGAAYSLSRLVASVATAKLEGLIFGDSKKSPAYFALGSKIAIQGLCAFALTAPLISGFTFTTALTLTAVIASVDIVSFFAFRHCWNMVF